jgi:hypothetical protein
MGNVREPILDHNGAARQMTALNFALCVLNDHARFVDGGVCSQSDRLRSDRRVRAAPGEDAWRTGTCPRKAVAWHPKNWL